MTIDINHPEAFCEKCHGPNIVWFVHSDLWNAASDGHDILCPTCFVELAESLGINPTAWELVPENLS